jgi:hypothetical protein
MPMPSDSSFASAWSTPFFGGSVKTRKPARVSSDSSLVVYALFVSATSL